MTARWGTAVAVRKLRMRVRLTKKYAERIDGVDLRGRDVGEIVELPAEKASLLLAERWAIPERRERSEVTANRRRADDYTGEISEVT